MDNSNIKSSPAAAQDTKKSGGSARTKMFLRMITASLIRRRSRMLAALMSIAIGATILSGLVTIYYDVPRQMGAQFRSYGANMILTGADGAFTQEDMDFALSQLGSAEVVGAAPYRYDNVRINESPVVAAGTDMQQASAASPYWSIEGELPASSGQIMVGAKIADSFRLKEGGYVTVTYTPELETEDGEVTADELMDFEITAILQTGGSEENYVYMSTEDIEALTGETDRIDVAELSISAGSGELSGFADKINSGSDAVSARLVKRVTASETTVLTKLQALVLLVTIVVLALTMICVATTMTAVVAERRREIGLRKAIGASDQSIIKEFMGESILLGLLGGILGSVLGFVFAQEVSVRVFSSSISFRPLLVPITVLVSIAVTGLSSLFPIKSATEVDPALVLKGE